MSKLDKLLLKHRREWFKFQQKFYRPHMEGDIEEGTAIETRQKAEIEAYIAAQLADQKQRFVEAIEKVTENQPITYERIINELDKAQLNKESS